MKKIALGLLALALIATGIQAQDKKMDKANKESKMHKGPRGGMKGGGMYKDLDLTQDQKDQIAKINAEHRAAMQDLKAKESTLTVADHKEQMKAIGKARHEKVQNVLTAEQKEKLEKKRTERKGKSPNARFHGKRGKGEMAKSHLNLTDEQSAKVKTIRSNTQSRIKSIRENTALTPEEKKQQTIAAFKQQNDEMKSVLTPEQVKKMEAMPKRGRQISK
ncbi:MAG: hypothetical protein KIT80_01675 [Chitinophagaceae bacterium]|nr:hypothetical protein [Chitinophagaceae bacterium]MCW5925596.1 hypothetical protein [Chitinophagaceae bacterium]